MGMFSQLAQGVDWSSMGQMILRIAAVLLCLVIHEVSHGLAAYHLGDPTAKQSHRLSLNPLRHLDPFGLIMMIAVGFGWAKPVPVDPRYFKKPKQGMAITALAGPASNFVLAYVSTIIYSMLFAVAQVLAMFLPDRWYGRWMQLERYGMIVLMAALWFGLLDGFLMAARNLVLNAMLSGANFAYLGMLSLLTR